MPKTVSNPVQIGFELLTIRAARRVNRSVTIRLTLAGKDFGRVYGYGDFDSDKGASISTVLQLDPDLRQARPTVRPRNLVVLSFLAMVLVPLAILAVYLFAFAAERFVSITGMSVRAEDSVAEGELLRGLSAFSGGGQSDSAILHGFLTSADIVARMDRRIGLHDRMVPPEFDPVYAQKPIDLEDLHRRWQRLVTASHDGRSGIVTLQVTGFSAQDAHRISLAVIEESAAMQARLSELARAESTELAQTELTRAERRLRDARQRLTAFRASARIIDPSASLEGQLGLMASLQGQMTEAQIALGLLRESSTTSDPRLIQAERRVEVVAAWLEGERRKFGLGGEGYANLTEEYEGLRIEVEYARESYLQALAALDTARAHAHKSGRYLAVHIAPVMAETAVLPRKGLVLCLSGLGLVMVWAVCVLAAKGIRDG